MIVTDMKRKSFILAILLIAIVGVWLSSSLSVANPIANNVESDRENYNDLKRRALVNLPNYGGLQGSIASTAWTNRTILQFLNVPYAEPPSGDKRFKAPVPIKPWHGVRNAEKFGTSCPTAANLKQKSKAVPKKREIIDIEDCLFMAIYSSNLNASRAVMVYIHGGGFYSNNAYMYPPDYLMESDIVYVVIEYRLHLLGFLSTNSDAIPGNAGLMDCVQALKFIKENIKHFGGDPNRITIFGQSSGAVMVSALVISPSVPENLFHRAIVQSGTIFPHWAYSNHAELDARNIARAVGLDSNQSIAMLNEAFMAMSVPELFDALTAYQKINSMHGLSPNGGISLTIGGPSNLLPHYPQKMLDSKSYNKSIPMIIGTTKDDGSYVATVAYDIFDKTNKLTDKDFMTKELIDALLKLIEINDETGTIAALSSLTYFTKEQLSSGDFGTCAPSITDMMGTALFKAPALKLAEMNTRVSPLETFLYTFDHKGEHSRFGYGEDTSHYPFDGGVHHSDDLIYLFPYPPDVAKLNEEDTKVAQIMVDLWTSFAINGVPNLPRFKGEDGNNDNATWPPYLGPTSAYLHINKDLKIGDDYRQEFTVRIRENAESSFK